MPANITKEWLVIFFVHEIVIYLTIIEDIIKGIEKKGCGSDTAFYLLRDKVKPDGNTLYFTLSVSYLEKKDGQFAFTEVQDIEIDNGDRHCWEQGLQYIFTKVQANRNMMITLSHGAAFGINRDFGPVSRLPQSHRFENIANAQAYKVYSNPYFFFDSRELSDLNAFRSRLFMSREKALLTKGMVSKDLDRKGRNCRSVELLWIADLANALNRLPGKPTIDVMLMINCYMQSFDTGYILRDHVTYLVAPQTGVPANGFDFDRLMDHLAVKSMSTEDLIKAMIKDYQARNPSGSIASDYVALSANKLSYYSEMLKVFELMLAIVKNNWEEIGQAVVLARETRVLYVSFSSNVYSSNELKMIDFARWAGLLKETFPSLFSDSELLPRLEALLDKVVIDRHIGSFFLVRDALPLLDKFGVSGVSLFFPTRQDIVGLGDMPWCAYFDQKVPSPFKNHSQWDEFLKDYFKLSD